MWLFFGLITFISATIFFFKTRLESSWKGTPEVVDNLPFQLKISRDKNGRMSGFKIGIQAQRNYDYALAGETTIDRFF